MQGSQLWATLSTEPDFSHPTDVDTEALWAQYFRRQKLLGQIVSGTMHPDDLLDCLSDDGLSPDNYLASVDQALEPFIAI